MDIIRKYFVNETTCEPYIYKEAGKDYKLYPFILASEALDRQFEELRLTPRSIKNFVKNAKMYLNHDSKALPVGEWKDIRIEDGKLKAGAWFHGIDEASSIVERYVAVGQLKAASIGFQSLKRSEKLPDDKSIAEIVSSNTYTGKVIVHEVLDILEASIVGLPANPDALMGKSLDSLVLKGLNNLFEPSELEINYIPVVEKAGAVLSKTNKIKLENAKSLIDEVIESAGADEMETGKSIDELIGILRAEVAEYKELAEELSKEIYMFLHPMKPEPKLVSINEFLNRK